MTINKREFMGSMVKELCEQGEGVIAWKLLLGETDSLDHAQRDRLVRTRNQIKARLESDSARRLKDSLVLVTSSGWSKEDDTTLPGKVFPATEMKSPNLYLVE